MSVFMEAIAVYRADPKTAHAAFALYKSYCNGHSPPRVPSMDTILRLAFRISRGWSVEEAAAREHVWRWHLAIKSSDQVLNTCALDPCVSIFGAPHTIGM